MKPPPSDAAGALDVDTYGVENCGDIESVPGEIDDVLAVGGACAGINCGDIESVPGERLGDAIGLNPPPAGCADGINVDVGAEASGVDAYGDAFHASCAACA